MLAVSTILLTAGLNPEASFLEGASVQSADLMHAVRFQLASTGEDWSTPDSEKSYIMLLLINYRYLLKNRLRWLLYSLIMNAFQEKLYENMLLAQAQN